MPGVRVDRAAAGGECAQWETAVSVLALLFASPVKTDEPWSCVCSRWECWEGVSHRDHQGLG